MKTFNEILDDLCEERLNHKYAYVQLAFSHLVQRGLNEEAAQIYAKQTAQDALNRAATRATADIQNGKAVIEKSSILTTEIRFV